MIIMALISCCIANMICSVLTAQYVIQCHLKPVWQCISVVFRPNLRSSLATNPLSEFIVTLNIILLTFQQPNSTI